MQNSHTNNHWKLVVIANDFHIPYHDERALALFFAFLRKEKPDWVILNGDFVDFWQISSFDKTPRAGKELQEEIKDARAILRKLRRTLPKARITWIEGNHEFRLRKYLIAHAPELYGLPSLSIPDLFGLKQLHIEYVPCQDGASRFVDTFMKVGEVYVGHFAKSAKHGGYAAKALVEEKGVSVIQGHTHRLGAHGRTTVDGRVLLGVENLSMCARETSYASHPNWQLGFTALYLDSRSGRVQWYPVVIGRHGFVWKDRLFAARGVSRVRQIRKNAA